MKVLVSVMQCAGKSTAAVFTAYKDKFDLVHSTPFAIFRPITMQEISAVNQNKETSPSVSCPQLTILLHFQLFI